MKWLVGARKCTEERRPGMRGGNRERQTAEDGKQTIKRKEVDYAPAWRLWPFFSLFDSYHSGGVEGELTGGCKAATHSRHFPCALCLSSGHLGNPARPADCPHSQPESSSRPAVALRLWLERACCKDYRHSTLKALNKYHELFLIVVK